MKPKFLNFFASEVNGAISWFQLPLIGSFQPSEFIKIVFCETLGKFILIGV